MSTWQDDVEYEEYVITTVRDEGRSFAIEADGCWLGVDKAKCEAAGKVPASGMVARYYGRGFGYPVRGLAIDGVPIYYETHDEYYHRQKAEQVIRETEQKAQADARRAEMDARVAALPDCFQKRIARFRANNPDFYWQHEDYEMASCVDAVKIAAAVRADDIAAFHKLGWEQQKLIVPDLSEGHSGNTFGMACRLARQYLTDPRLVFADHAAIAQLVGCKEAGCPPVTNDELIAAGYEPFAPAPSSGTGRGEDDGK